MSFISRRRFIARMGLSGAAGAWFAPLLGRLIPEAMGAVPSQRRVVFVNLGHGIEESVRRPAAVRSPSDFDLSESMAALVAHKNRLNIVDGLYNSNSGDLHGPSATYYSCTTMRSTSIDQVIAAGIPTAPRGERSVHLGINGEPLIVEGKLLDGGAGAFSRGGAGIVPARNPIEAVKTLFGQAPAPAGTTAPATPGGPSAADRKLALLAHMTADVRKARMRLAGPEREKLDLYLASLEQMEMRTRIIKTMPIAATGATGRCTAPNVSAIKANNVSTTFPWDKGTGALNSAAALRDAYAQIALNVLACGISNVVTVEMFNGGNSIYLLEVFEGEPPELSNGTRATLSHLHDVYHGKIKNETFWNTLPADQRTAIARRVKQRYMNLAILAVKQIADGLAAIPEAGGTMLDNTIIVWGSDSGGGHHNGQVDLPVVLLGNIGGQLKGPRYLRFPRATKPQTELWLALANLMDARDASGAPLRTFGAGGKDPCSGPLPLA
jgi:hypothetical protein